MSKSINFLGRRYPFPTSWEDGVRLLMNGLQDHAQAIDALNAKVSPETAATAAAKASGTSSGTASSVAPTSAPLTINDLPPNLRAALERGRITMDDIEDGAFYAKTRASALTANLVDPTKDGVLKTGSVPPAYNSDFTYTSDTVSITWSWTLVGYRTNFALTQFSENGSQAVTGLASGTSYNFFPDWDEAGQKVEMVTTGGVGTPAWAHVGINRAWTAEQSRQDHIPLSTAPMAASTTSSGTGGGSGGGDGGCLHECMYVRERRKGVIRCTEVKVGDLLWGCGDKWLLVLKVDSRPHDLWVLAEFNNHAAAKTTANHPYTPFTGEGTVRACELTLETGVPCPTGEAFPEALRVVKEQANKVPISLEWPHTFFASMDGENWILTHNIPVGT